MYFTFFMQHLLYYYHEIAKSFVASVCCKIVLIAIICSKNYINILRLKPFKCVVAFK